MMEREFVRLLVREPKANAPNVTFGLPGHKRMQGQVGTSPLGLCLLYDEQQPL
jgi:hypothetical protein